jgi:tetratricopeptide (TPR) repeat protein
VTERVPAFGVLAAAGAALLAFVVLLLPWLGERWSAQATETLSTQHAVTLAQRARSVDPLIVEPLWALAFAYENKPSLALAYYDQATKKQPANPQTWLLAGRYALSIGCPRHAYPYLERYTELDPNAPPGEGGDAYRRALELVNSGKPTC